MTTKDLEIARLRNTVELMTSGQRQLQSNVKALEGEVTEARTQWRKACEARDQLIEAVTDLSRLLGDR